MGRNRPVTSSTVSPADSSVAVDGVPFERRARGRAGGRLAWRSPGRPARRPWRARSTKCALHVGRHQRRRQVTLGAEVLGQGAVDRVGDGPEVRLARVSLAVTGDPTPGRRLPVDQPPPPGPVRCRGTRCRGWAPRLSVRARAEASSAAASCSRFASSPGRHRDRAVAQRRRPCPRRRRGRRRGSRRCGRRRHRGHGALQRVAQLRDVEIAPVRRSPAGPAAAGRSTTVHPMPSIGLVSEHGPQRAARLGTFDPRSDALGQSCPEDHALEQRVGGEPVGSVDPGAGHLAHRPQSRQRRGAPQVGDHAPREVVRRRRDREPVASRGRGRWTTARRRWWGSAAGKRSRPVASSQRWSTPCSSMRAAMARLTTSRGASSSTKRSPVPVAQERAVAAQRLGQQGPGHGGVVQRRRVELHELDVGGRHAGPQRHGHAVAGRLGRVGGDREELAGSTGGQHDVVGPHLDRAAGATGRQRQDADAAPTLDEEVEGEPAFEHRAGRTVGGVDERPLHLGPRCRAAGVDDPRAGSGRPHGPGPGSPWPRGRTRRRAR